MDTVEKKKKTIMYQITREDIEKKNRGETHNKTTTTTKTTNRIPQHGHSQQQNWQQGNKIDNLETPSNKNNDSIDRTEEKGKRENTTQQKRINNNKK